MSLPALPAWEKRCFTPRLEAHPSPEFSAYARDSEITLASDPEFDCALTVQFSSVDPMPH